ncbi:hypothetical protein E2542_SST23706 [Spatholobus suberectus]|nr:hypothetical protein E2542_SST23706 [Spatholobus suberectus]
MDQREFHLQPMGICSRLYHFLTKALASQAFKKVTLGRSRHHNSSSTAVRGSDSKAKQEEDEEKNNPCMNVDKMEGENVTPTSPATSLAPTGPIKKTVSMNENVVEIPPPRKLKKWSSSVQKSSSLDQDEESTTTTPRSILKVGSDLNDKSNPVS